MKIMYNNDIVLRVLILTAEPGEMFGKCKLDSEFVCYIHYNNYILLQDLITNLSNMILLVHSGSYL